MVEARRTAKTKELRYDLFSNLLDANEDEADSALKLTDSKLIGTRVPSPNLWLNLACAQETCSSS